MARTNSQPMPTEKAHPFRVFLLSASILILELAFIRQVPAEVKSISYFSNLILMSSFFGLGIGCLLGRSKSVLWLMPCGLLATFLFIYFTRGLVVFEEAGQVHYWLQHEQEDGMAPKISLFVSAILAFIVTSLPFAALGQALAQEMDKHPRLKAYAWDIGGSLCGTLLFSLGAYLEFPPWLFPPLVALVFALCVSPSVFTLALFAFSGAPFFAFANSPNISYWSPYYLVQYKEETDGLRVWVNSSFHQFAVDFSAANTEARKMQESVGQRFSLTYNAYREHHGGKSPEKVLILGAGTGNDVNIALMNQAQSITAVEIDPVIANLGQNLNRTAPYTSSKVKLVIDDARHYLQSTNERFDFIVFGTLDSQTLLSGIANLRLENYVYTKEAMLQAREVLRDGGMVSLYYSVFKPWLYARIFSTVHSAFPDGTQIFFSDSSFLFNTIILAGKNVPGFQTIQEEVSTYGSGLPSVDDWPFLYLEKPTLADIYVKLLLAVFGLLIISFVVQRRLHRSDSAQLEFLFLGLGFTLMESAAIVRMALLFGSTWIVNAVVFAAVLLTIFIANILVSLRFTPALKWCWPALLLCLAFNALMPIGMLTQFAFGLRVLACGLLIGLPVFFAACAFSKLFEKQLHTGSALGINLIGAMSGGFIEYLSMLLGMRAIWFILIVVYASAWAFSHFKSTALVEEVLEPRVSLLPNSK